MVDSNYKVVLADFADRHYVKDFSKKYKSHWPTTLDVILELCRRIDRMLDFGRQQASLIKTVDQHQLVKLEFAVVGTRKSSKSAGNRVILWVDNGERTVTILMVYDKGHIKGKQGETVWWQQEVRNNVDGVNRTFWAP